MFSFFRKKAPQIAAPEQPPTSASPPAATAPIPVVGPVAGSVAQTVSAPAITPAPLASAPATPAPTHIVGARTAASAAAAPAAHPAPAGARQGWLAKLKNGLRKTGSTIATVFTGTQIDDALYEELESALLMSDAGVAATEHLLAEAFADLLRPLQRPLHIGEFKPTVMMIAGVNGAGKTTSIGKLTKHLADSGATVLLAAADTFRAAAREQLAVWADRNAVDIISQEGGDPAAVSFDAVAAGKARGRDVVMVDTAGRLPTQLHLMEEIKKIKRVVTKADSTAPHEVLLVIDGNTGQNALAQVKAFDEALQVTGLIITKLDGTAKGGVIAAIALWARERSVKQPALRPMGIYFVGVGEKLEDLETFDATEFATALVQ